MGQFGVVVGQLTGFFIMLLIGYICVRLRLYGMTALNGMCSLLLNVLIPVLVFSNAVAGTDRAELFANWGIILLTAIMYALLILVFWVVAHLLRLKGGRNRIFQASMIFGNAGFIGIPLVMSLFPKNGAIYVALMSMVDQGLLWTYGTWLCEPSSKRQTATGNATITASAAQSAAVGGTEGVPPNGPCAKAGSWGAHSRIASPLRQPCLHRCDAGVGAHPAGLADS